MSIVNYFFNIIKNIFNIYNTDIFGLGFTYLDLILSSIIIITIVSFLLRSYNNVDNGFNFFSIVNPSLYNKNMDNQNRVRQVVNSETGEVKLFK